MKTISVMNSWGKRADLLQRLKRLSPQGDGIWGRYQFVTDASADYYLAINSPLSHYHRILQPHEPSKTIIWIVEHDDAKWLADFDYPSVPKEEKYLRIVRMSNNLNWIELHINQDYESLSVSPTKTKDLSAVISSKTELPTQQLRVDLLKYLESQDLSFSSNELDHFGASNDHQFRYYRGSLPDYTKDQGLLPYKYTIAIEAGVQDNYITEKLFDAILSECLVFYYGCPNISKWFPEDSYVWIDPNHPEDAFQKIRETIMSDGWSKRIDAVRMAKSKILNEYNTLNRISSWFDALG